MARDAPRLVVDPRALRGLVLFDLSLDVRPVRRGADGPISRADLGGGGHDLGSTFAAGTMLPPRWSGVGGSGLARSHRRCLGHDLDQAAQGPIDGVRIREVGADVGIEQHCAVFELEQSNADRAVLLSHAHGMALPVALAA